VVVQPMIPAIKAIKSKTAQKSIAEYLCFFDDNSAIPHS